MQFQILSALFATLLYGGVVETRQLKLKVTSVWTFPVGTFVENLAVRSNGQILASVLTQPRVYQVDHTMQRPAALVATIPHHRACAGITEITKDVFYVIASNFTVKGLDPGPHSASVWKLDVSNFKPGGLPTTPTLVAKLPKAGVLNGMTTLNAKKGLVVIADPILGVVWRLNGHTGEKKITISDPLMRSVSVIGINGVKILENHLYWTNSDRKIIAKIPISSSGYATGPASIVANVTDQPDDFILRRQPNKSEVARGFIAGSDEIQGFKGANVYVASRSKLLAGSTACEFARNDENAQGDLYVSTSGGNEQYQTGNVTNPGKIVRISFS